MKLLTVNAGSSSVRLALFDGEARIAEIHHGGETDPGTSLKKFLGEFANGVVDGAAHRIVHGGPHLSAPCVLDAAAEAEIRRFSAFAPLHNPKALEWIEACRKILGLERPQVAVFDTAYFANLPERSRIYAIPRALSEQHGLHRYGFHGLAHAAMWRHWAELRPERAADGRIISLQLGGGASIAATHAGRPVDTSMGFSPLEGLVMATRSGDVDPGLILYLQREAGFSLETLEQLLNHESGLAGLAGESDMQRLLARADAQAALALDLYCYRARKYIGAYFAVLGSVDAVLFGGGIGEHAPRIRAGILAGLEGLGIAVDPAANENAVAMDAAISRPGARIEIRIIRVDEEAELASAARTVIATL